MSSLSHFCSALIKLFSLFPLTTPETVATIYWDMIYGLTVLVYIFYIPMKISFSIQKVWFSHLVHSSCVFTEHDLDSFSWVLPWKHADTQQKEDCFELCQK